ncbi:hypothetical protein AAL_00523 [Moelleriella libera RCEF 2490]|uniref:Glycoprotease family protein n=1 Tax=Moelleriella libera RCEF 2490 TaxID=1081109 RepID=A0A166UX72_9HYPO|nr:hypothetical protein AAL_00523 [Moelleriella libera RCEF 2490]
MAAPYTSRLDRQGTKKTRLETEDWEDWEDDNIVAALNQHKVSNQGRDARRRETRASRLSSRSRFRRLRLRQRQKTQGDEDDIRLITDASIPQPDHCEPNHIPSRPTRTGKYVDAAALSALEGDPNANSAGNWNWLKEDVDGTSIPAGHKLGDRAQDQELSPDDRPIMIGIALPPSGAEPCAVSPLTVSAAGGYSREHGPAYPGERDVEKSQISVWSIDTTNRSYSPSPRRIASSVYSQATMLREVYGEEALPPIPTAPFPYTAADQRDASVVENGMDSGAPDKASKKDGMPGEQNHAKMKGAVHRPDSTESRSHGWWDHVVTPFVDKRMSFPHRKQKMEKGKEKHRCSQGAMSSADNEKRTDAGPVVPIGALKVPIIRSPTPRQTSGRGTGPEQQRQATAPPVVFADNALAAASAPKMVAHRDLLSTPDCPPPYSSPRSEDAKKAARGPPGQERNTQFNYMSKAARPNPAADPSSQAGVNRPSKGRGPGQEPLPDRVAGTFVPHAHAYSAAGSGMEVERQRRRHEKEDVLARRAGGCWRGRGCVSSKGCYGRTGREGRKRRRVCFALCAVITALVVLLIILLAVLLTRRQPATDAPYSRWVNLTDFPPMPTGVSTVVGPDNTNAKSICTQPSTLWSCSLSKDKASSVAPYKPNQPLLIMQIQWDNGTKRAWNTANGDAPLPLARRALAAAVVAGLRVLRRAPAPAGAVGFVPEPRAPSFKEMWFLGNTTDKVKSDQKAGEPTPFYISLLKSVNDTVGLRSLSKRDSSPDIGNTTFKNLVPPPELEADGTSVPAVLMPNPVQQPVRLYDRGLPTEHYGFYTYFRKTMFAKSVTVQNQTVDGVPLDQDGGCRKSEASYVVTWGETRLLVQMWTRALDSNASKLLVPDKGSRGIGGAGALIRPGNMPYPVTVTHDTHGGNPDRKLVWARAVNERLQVQKDSAEALVNNMGLGGTWLNRRGSGNAKYGGFDGGTGGCKCEWANWV